MQRTGARQGCRWLPLLLQDGPQSHLQQVREQERGPRQLPVPVLWLVPAQAWGQARAPVRGRALAPLQLVQQELAPVPLCWH